MIGAGALVEVWLLLLLAAGAGVAIALAYLAADYLLVPALRLRAARRLGPEALARLMDHERSRLFQLRDQAAVCEEHNHPNAAALWEEAELRALVLEMMKRGCEASGRRSRGAVPFTKRLRVPARRR